MTNVRTITLGARSALLLEAAPKAPLIIGLHGGISNPTTFALQSGLVRAVEAGFTVCLPYGTGATAKALTWNAGTCCGYAKRRGVDDLEFLNRLALRLERRPFVVGFSNGAMLAYLWAATYPETVGGRVCCGRVTAPHREAQRPGSPAGDPRPQGPPLPTAGRIRRRFA